jgi:hypothetical protein
MLNAEMDHHLTQEAAEPDRHCANYRNGYSKKTECHDPLIRAVAVSQNLMDRTPIRPFQF